MRKILFVALFGLFAQAISANVFAGTQNNQNGEEETLFTVGGESVSKDEFEYVYRKNNPAKQNDYSSESLREYLDLYINFKLKVKEARMLQIDTIDAVQLELERYRQQLVKSYFDKEVSDKMLEESYDRMKREIEVSHIMLAVKENATPNDTLTAYNRINQVRQGLVSGNDWNATAKDVSHDQYTKNEGGYLGYMTALQVPDDRFEEMIYSTKKGDISPVFRTQYGYHIIKTGNSRQASGTVKVAHILLKTPKDPVPDKVEEVRMRTQAYYDQIMSGAATFDSLARNFSEDNNTRKNGGELPEFGTGKMLPAFEAAAFGLNEEGELSKPVRTQYGWHIIRLLEKSEMGSFEDVKSELNRRLQRSGRYDKARNGFIRDCKTQYKFTESEANYNAFVASVDSSLLINTWRARKAQKPETVLFNFGSRAFTVGDFATHVQRSQRTFRDNGIKQKVDRLYNQFVEEMTIEHALSQRHEDFRRLLKEYRDGILLFELTEEKVWQKAMQDTVGLEQFYEQNKSNYMWGDRVDATIYTISNPDMAKKVRKSLKKGMSPDALRAKYNKSGLDEISVESGRFAKGQNTSVDNAGMKTGLSGDQDNEDGTVTIVNITELVPPSNKSLSEAKGYVISDYQEHLESIWVKELRNKYPVQINDTVLNAMIK